MTKKATLVDVSSGYTSQSTLNDNFEALNDQFDNTLSLDGSTPNSMSSDLDLNGNDILNTNDMSISGTLTIEGTTVVPNDLATVPNWEGTWTTATDYVKNDLVREDGSTYICLVAHTSGTFATDLSALKWELFAQQGAAGAGTGDMLAANNLSDVASPATSLANLNGQPVDVLLTAISGLDIVANEMIYGTGTDTVNTTAFTLQGRTLVGKGSVSEMRDYLSLGSAATRDIDDTTDLTVNPTDVLSRGGVKTYVESIAGGIGFAPTAEWQNVSSSRSNNVAYQNTSSYMIFVYAWQSSISVSPTNSSYSTITSGTSGTDFGYSWVPIMPDHWYKIPNATLVWELKEI